MLTLAEQTYGQDEVTNVYQGKPVPGTVFGTLEPEEIQEWHDLNLSLKAAKYMLPNPNTTNAGRFYEAQEALDSFWAEKIHKRFSIPYAWNINIDPLTGYIYLVR